MNNMAFCVVTPLPRREAKVSEENIVYIFKTSKSDK
jgi:hypothetical protein